MRNSFLLDLGIESASASIAREEPELPILLPGLITQGLVSWWAFDGNLLDSSGNENHGPDASNPPDPSYIFTVDRYRQGGQAYSFTAVEDILDMGNDTTFDLEDKLSISVWVRLGFDVGGNHGVRDIITKGESFNTSNDSYSYYISISGEGNITFAVKTANQQDMVLSYAAKDRFFKGDWVHIVGTYNHTVQNLYINSKLQDTQASSGVDVLVTTHPVVLGGNNHFIGSMDNCRIYHRVLAPGEVGILYGE